jgi:hypothetical protein
VSLKHFIHFLLQFSYDKEWNYSFDMIYILKMANAYASFSILFALLHHYSWSRMTYILIIYISEKVHACHLLIFPPMNVV